MNAEKTEEPTKKIARIEQKGPKIITKTDRSNMEISIPNWLVESLAFVTRNEMANSGLSTSSWIFHRLCRAKLHGNVEPHMVGPIKLNGECDWQSGNLRAIARCGGQLLPIPSTPPPEYIIGFERISIFFLDDRVLEFIKYISPKLDEIKFIVKMNFDFYWRKWNVRDKRIRALQCLLNALDGRIGCFNFTLLSNFKLFNQHFRQFIDQCQCIWISHVSPKFKKPDSMSFSNG